MVLKLPSRQNIFPQKSRDNIGVGKNGILSIPPSAFFSAKDKNYVKTISQISLTATSTTTTKDWSCAGNNFMGVQPGIDDLNRNNGITTCTGGATLAAPVFLPDGVTVTKALVNGNADTETWGLYRNALDGTSNTTMGSASIDTEDTTISNATIDNGTYKYYFSATNLDAGEAIHGARITYEETITEPSSTDDLFVEVNLPNNSTITELTVFGNATAQNDDYELFKINRSGTATSIFGDAIAQAIGTAKTRMVEVINNNLYSYVIKIDQTYGIGDGTWIIYGAEVKYTQ